MALRGETDSDNLSSPVTAARLSFRHDTRSSFYAFTVHPQAGNAVEEQIRPAINNFIAALSSPPFRTDSNYLPPILLGDLNSLANNPRSITGFVEVARAVPDVTSPPFAHADVMTIRRGDSSFFPSIHDYSVAGVRVLGGDLGRGLGNLDAQFSDHIGLLARFSWLCVNLEACAGSQRPLITEAFRWWSSGDGLIVRGFGLAQGNLRFTYYDANWQIRSKTVSASSGWVDVNFGARFNRERLQEVWIPFDWSNMAPNFWLHIEAIGPSGETSRPLFSIRY